MRLMAAALALSLTLAVVAAVFAMWPVVADAPWEDEASKPVVEDRTGEIRCEAALSLRETVIQTGRRSFNNPAGLSDYADKLAQAEREIAQYC